MKYIFFSILMILASGSLANELPFLSNANTTKPLLQNQQNQSHNWSPEDTKVFGLTEQDVLNQDGDPEGTACSRRHSQGDMSNRWCHAFFVKAADSFLRAKGLSKNPSALLSASIFVPKEYGIDKKPSRSDLVMAEYEIYETIQAQYPSRMTVTVFGDTAMFMNFEQQF